MLHLLIRAGGERYLMDVAHIVEVLPLVQWTRTPQAPDGVLGVFSYHGSTVPLLDLGEVLHDTPTPARMGTRILLVRHTAHGAEPHLLGLVVEEAIRFLRREPADFTASPVTSGPASVRTITRVDDDIVQGITPEELLDPALLARLLGSPAPQGG